MIEQIEPCLVVLDTLRELHSSQEDRSDEMGPLLRPLRQLAHQTGTTILVNHHQNRGGTFRGSTAIRAAFDLEWAFGRSDDNDEEGEPRGTLRVEGRHGPRTVIKVRLGNELRWELDQTIVVPRDLGARERILACLDLMNSWQTAEEIATGTSLRLKTVQNVLATMAKERPRPFAMDGVGTKSDPRRYRTLAPHFDGFGGDGAQDMIPPEAAPIGNGGGGNHFRGQNGEAGNDRWTR